METSWSDKWDIVIKAFLDDSEEESENLSEYDLEEREAYIEENARKLVTNEEYLSEPDSFNKNRLAVSILESDLKEPNDVWTVIRRARQIFFKEVKPAQDKALRIQINDLKEKGSKKVQISSKLEISMHRLNQLWY